MTSKLRSKPPIASAEDFIGGADQRTRESKPGRKQSKSPPSVPWEDPQVREDVLKVYNLRFPEPYLLKLKHIAAHTPDSMHQFCINVLLPAIDKKVKELI